MLPKNVRTRLLRGLFSAAALCCAVGVVSCVGGPVDPITSETDPEKDPDEEGGPGSAFLLEEGGGLLAIHFDESPHLG